MKTKLSVVLATFNEEENLKRCLDSVKGIADEIIIIDGNSQDKTVAIAKSFKAKVIQTTNKPNFHINKQMGLKAAENEWILQLDADEVVSPNLAKEIVKVINMSEDQINNRQIDPIKLNLFSRHQSLIEARDGIFSKESGSISAFFIPRSNYFLGRLLKYAGTYPDGVIRLVKNGQAKFPCKSVHEQIQISGRVSWLANDLIHYDSPTFSKYIQRANRYTSFTASQLKAQRIPINFKNHLYYLFIKPIKIFCSLFFRHKGFLDKFPGFVFSLFSGLHYSMAYMKYWEEVK
jgi:glycosyltransferase involved in cell wall biosynthesis